MKKILSLLLVSVLMFSTVSALAADKVGVAMPTQSLPRWVRDGDLMKTKLEAAGFEVDLQFANNDVATQVSQLENMISGGAKVLVVQRKVYLADATDVTEVVGSADRLRDEFNWTARYSLEQSITDYISSVPR